MKKDSILTILIYIISITIVSLLLSLDINFSFFSSKPQFNTSKFNKSHFELDFNREYKNSVINISEFEPDESWTGDFEINDVNYMEGLSSYRLKPKSNNSIVELNKKLDLSAMSIVKLYVFLEKGDFNSITNFKIKFSEQDNLRTYEYVLPKKLKFGWNLLKLPISKFSPSKKENQVGWNKINKVTLELSTLPGSQVRISVDRLWAEKTQEYSGFFKSANTDIVSLKKNPRGTALEVVPLTESTMYINKVGTNKDFLYMMKIIPESQRGTFAMSFRVDPSTNYGYYFELSGLEDSGWRLYKLGRSPKGTLSTQLSSGILNDVIFEGGKPIWIKIETNGSKIIGFVSVDGINFNKLTEVNDDEFMFGGIGFLLGESAYLIESIAFKS